MGCSNFITGLRAKQHRQAIRRHHGTHLPRDITVNGIRSQVGWRLPIQPHYTGTMDLLQPDWHLRQAGTLHQPLAVIRHRPRIITHVGSEVERVIRR
ncbi:hypothetical protein D3C73_1226620 [compost metagenome]